MQLTGEQIRWLLIAIAAFVALAFCVFFAIRHRKKDAALALLLGSLLTVFFVLSEFHSAAEYGQGNLPPVKDGDPTVTFTIDASAALAYPAWESLPEGGILFPETVLLLLEGESVMELLQRVTEAADLRIEVGGGYVEGIANLYEFDCGNESGWMYTVNGEMPGVSAADYRPEDGDTIGWIYVTTYAEREGFS